MKIYTSFFIAFVIFLSACKSGVTSDVLYGKWKYTRVENPNQHPPGKVSAEELEAQAPYIEFTKNNELKIFWGGELLSHGTFNVDGTNIHYKEVLADGRIREFPFFISAFTGKDMTFETLGEEGTRVTAVKQ